MKTWVAVKNEHKASVQRRWDNRGKMNIIFQRWRKGTRHEYEKQTEGEVDGDGRIEKEKRNFCKWGLDDSGWLLVGNVKTPEMGASGLLRPTSSNEEILPYHTIQKK
eukprot:6213062-Pleurochrysis_carterae.AAC.4